MKFESIGILIDQRPFGDRDSVAHIFTRDFGIMCGMLRGAQIAKKNKPLVGQIGFVSWNARLESQLGVFHWESEKNLIAPLMNNFELLSFANSAFGLLKTLLPEREKYESLYIQTENLLKELAGFNKIINDIYLSWEINLLKELGYALDLSRCSNCGCVNNLTQISQKTGRAVCDKCAQPWLHQCFELPINLEITKKFLQKLVQTHDSKLPIAREILTEKMGL